MVKSELTKIEPSECGLCDATCPNEAIRLRHFERAQILAMIDSLFEEEWGVKGE